MPQTLETNLHNLVVAIATDITTLNTLLNGNVLDLEALTTTSKTSVVSAINELKTALSNVPSNTTLNNTVTAAIAALIDSAPAALDTLKELADANATVLSALGNRIRFDAPQTLTQQQKDQAIANLGTIAASLIGDPTVDLVAIYLTGRE